MCEDEPIETGGFRFSLRALMAGVALAAFGCLVISCSFDLRCRVMVRRAGDDGRYHVTAVQLHDFSYVASELLGKRLRELPELGGVRVLPDLPRYGEMLLKRLQRELPGRRVEYLSTYGDW
jgi:hypothetical protein